MKIRLFILILFCLYITTIGKQQYIDCYNNVVKYTETRKAVEKENKKLEELQGKQKESNSKIKENSLSLYSNRDKLITAVSSVKNCKIEGVSALNINNKDDILVVANSNNIEDIKSFSASINCIEFAINTNDYMQVLKAFESLDCLIYGVKVDKIDNNLKIQIISIKE